MVSGYEIFTDLIYTAAEAWSNALFTFWSYV